MSSASSDCTLSRRLGATVSLRIIVELTHHIRIRDKTISCFAELAHYVMSGRFPSQNKSATRTTNELSQIPTSLYRHEFA